jgi:hypothetical protein
VEVTEDVQRLGLPRKIIRKQAGNLGILGGKIVRDSIETPAPREVPVEELVLNVLEEGGPMIYHCDSEEQQHCFESTCRKLRRILEQQPR